MQLEKSREDIYMIECLAIVVNKAGLMMISPIRKNCKLMIVLLFVPQRLPEKFLSPRGLLIHFSTKLFLVYSILW